MSRALTHAALTVAAPIGTVGALLLVIGCLATERDRGKALADGIRYVRSGCEAYLRDPAIPRHPEADASCPVIVAPPVAPSSSPPVLDASAGEPDGAVLNVAPGNAVRAVDGG